MKSNTVINMEEKAVTVQYDTGLLISEGKSRYETQWKNKKVRWSMLLKRLSESFQTHETHAEYMKMPKDKQDQIKDIGGFVGGHLKDGRRKNGNVAARQIVTLDADFAPKDLVGELEDSFALDCAMAVYSTHKHTQQAPRLRVIIPLDREVTPDEYEAIARKVAEKIGIDYFDDTTYQATRLMYWPSHPADVDPYFWMQDAPILKADDVLKEYRDWTDVAEWPESSRMTGIRKKQADRQGDPTEKKGIVGLFCRTYDVIAAMDAFMPGVYVPTSKDDRYTFAAGSTAAGVVIYEDGKFMYSNHGTDPLGGQLLNAFDMVRLYKFAELDEGSDQRGMNAPSFKAMRDLVREDENCRRQMYAEKDAEAKSDFAEGEEADWRTKLELTQNMTIATSLVNAAMIIRMDEHLQGIRYNDMSRRIDAENVPWERTSGPWRDADDARLAQWIAEEYHVEFPRTKFDMAKMAVADERHFNPVREYLESLPVWDGIERVDTLLVKYLGAEDSPYTREVTRKCLTAAIARIYQPGVKFDTVPVLQGPQGIGKSMIFDRLAVAWFSDALSISDMRDKTAAEKLQGYWIVEISEMAGMRKTEEEAVKSFLSRRDDIYRAAYGHNVESRLRQCIIVGSTNEDSGFLRDSTGNRRFWPVIVTGRGERSPWDLTPADVAQIWAEAKIGYELGEDLLLSPEVSTMAEEAQRKAMESDARQGLVENYLSRKLPKNWETMDVDRRLLFLDSDEEGTEERQTVSNIEIWTEALRGSQMRMEPKDARAITMMMAAIPGWKKNGNRVYLGAYGRQRIYVRDKGQTGQK